MSLYDRRDNAPLMQKLVYTCTKFGAGLELVLCGHREADWLTMALLHICHPQPLSHANDPTSVEIISVYCELMMELNFISHIKYKGYVLSPV